MPEPPARRRAFIVFQSFIGKRCELGRMGRVAGVGLRIAGSEVARGAVLGRKNAGLGVMEEMTLVILFYEQK